jgi:hypothetical protein
MIEETIFINYRRGGDQAAAGRLYDQLEGTFTRARIFFDVDSIPPGWDFTEELAQRVNQCDIFLAIIGRHWADVVDSDGGRRLENPNDWVRVEIESALRLGKHIIPVLVDGAEMPSPTKLPESLRPLTRRNALRLTHERFRADAQALAAAIGKLREEARARAKSSSKKRGWSVSRTDETERSELESPRQEKARTHTNHDNVTALNSLGATPAPIAARRSVRVGYIALVALALVAGVFGLMFTLGDGKIFDSTRVSVLPTSTPPLPTGAALDEQKLDALINKNAPFAPINKDAPFAPAPVPSSLAGSALDKQKLDALINKNAPFAPAPKQ